MYEKNIEERGKDEGKEIDKKKKDRYRQRRDEEERTWRLGR